MDQENLKPNPDQISSGEPSDKNSASENSDPNVTPSSQVFDILEDNILPARETIEEEKRSSPPQESDLLDKKIGTFDQSPFAPETKSATPKVPSPRPPLTFQQQPSTPTIGLYPNRPTQQTSVEKTGNQPVEPTPIKPVETVSIPKPTVPETRPVTTVNNIQRRSLQEEATAALPANLRGDQVSPNKPPIAQKPTEQSSISSRYSQNRFGSANPWAQPDSEKDQREMAKPIRTYESDVAEMMSHKKTSTASIAIAENEKQKGSESLGNDEKPSQAWKKIAITITSLILLFGGAYGAYYLYSQSALAPVQPTTQPQKTVKSIIPADNQAVVTVESKSLTSIMQGLTNEIGKNQSPNTIKEIIVATKMGTGGLVRVSAPEMIGVLGIKPPDILKRSITEEWMMGVYNNQDNEKSVFVVGTTNFFQNSFAGMLQWEGVMADDLRQYFYPKEIEGISNETIVPSSPVINDILRGIDSILPSSATTTSPSTIAPNSSTTNSENPAIIPTDRTATSSAASSTIETVRPLREYSTISGKFEDRIIKNKDVRAFRVNNGGILFLYSFFDNIHFIITDKETTMIEVIDRLEKQSFIR